MYNIIYNLINLIILGIGDWGLGNPQSPIPNPQSNYLIKLYTRIN